MAITSQKLYARAKRDLLMVDGQLARIQKERETAAARFDAAERLIRAQADEIRREMKAWETKTTPAPSDEQRTLAGAGAEL